MEENDFRAYIASSTSGEDDDPPAIGKRKGKAKDADREKLRALLLGGGDDLPEGWGGKGLPGADEGDVDIEITFTPGLSENKVEESETTLDKYKRKMREKKKKRKEERLERWKTKPGDEDEGGGRKAQAKGDADDEFFGGDSEDEGTEGGDEAEEQAPMKKGKKDKTKGKKGRRESASPPPARHVSTAEELALVAGPSGDGANEPKHFDMKAVIRAEKGAKLKNRKNKKGKKSGEGDNELQEDFHINVNDDRFKAALEDHAFAIDPSNPQYVGASMDSLVVN